MSNTVREQFKQQSIEAAERTQNLRIFKYRLESDDGWYHFTARTITEARKKYPNRQVLPSAFNEVYGIAVRALEGY